AQDMADEFRRRPVHAARLLDHPAQRLGAGHLEAGEADPAALRNPVRYAVGQDLAFPLAARARPQRDLGGAEQELPLNFPVGHRIPYMGAFFRPEEPRHRLLEISRPAQSLGIKACRLPDAAVHLILRDPLDQALVAILVRHLDAVAPMPTET